MLFSGYALMDYTVVARNYGLSMLIVAAIAWRYRRWRDRGVGLGLLLFLLCNTNAPSVLVAGGLLLFRAGELLSEEGLRPTAASRHLLWTAGLAALGVLTCAATLYPPYNDAVGLALSGGDTVPIAGGFRLLIPFDALTAGLQSTRPGALLFVVILVGSILGLARAPAALAAATVVGLGFELFFRLVYPGFYRHQALFVLLLIALYWLVAQGFGGRWPERIERRWQQAIAAAERYGSLAFAALLALQCVVGIGLVVQSAQGAVFSRSADLAALLEQPALRQAVVIANPDLLLEPLPYYVDNPAWIVRERRWGHVTAFTKAAMRDVSLAELLATAKVLRAKTRRPVVIVVSRRLDAAAPPQAWRQGYLGRFLTTPAQVRAFLGATRRLARFAPAVTDESYDVYLLR